jgi:dienelactone hydrolase
MSLSQLGRMVSAAALAAACSTTGRGTVSGSAEGLRNARSDDVSFPTPNGEIVSGDLYGAGDRGVVIIAHGGYSTKKSWESQARTLSDAGFRVLVFDSRAAVDFAAGKETPCMYDAVCQAVDVLSAVRYLRTRGATRVSVIGGSMGGGATAQASVESAPGEIDRIVLLAPAAIAAPEKMKGRKLFIVARDDANSAGLRLPTIRDQFERAAKPKQLMVLEGVAHGQRIFGTEQGERVMREIQRFLSDR